MDKVLIILVVGASTYVARLSGFLLRDRPIPRIVDQFLLYVPVAVFAALVTPSVGVGTGDTPARLLGVGATALVISRVRQLWAGLAAGMAVYWIARAVGLG
jgi:branched-subunit amino acid transport protein